MTSLVPPLSPRLIIVGGGYAGILAANRARRRLPAAHITLVSESARFVDRIRLHEHLATGREVETALRDELSDVDLVVGRATGMAHRALRLGDGRELPFDHLIVAAGSTADTERTPGTLAHTLPVIQASRAALAPVLQAGGRVTVVGGGFTGLELAAELAEAHPRAQVQLVTSGALGPALGATARAATRRQLARLGVALCEGVAVEAVEAGALLTRTGRVPFDACVWAGGFRATALPATLGLAVDERGRARVDSALRAVGHPEIRVVGDAAAVEGALGSPLLPGCKTAMPLGAHAVDALVAELSGAPPAPFAFRDTGYCVSLGRSGGVVQPVDARGRAWRWALTGAPAAFVKERVCRYVRWSLRAERDRRVTYRWVRSSEALA